MVARSCCRSSAPSPHKSFLSSRASASVRTRRCSSAGGSEPFTCRFASIANRRLRSSRFEPPKPSHEAHEGGTKNVLYKLTSCVFVCFVSSWLGDSRSVKNPPKRRDGDKHDHSRQHVAGLARHGSGPGVDENDRP